MYIWPWVIVSRYAPSRSEGDVAAGHGLGLAGREVAHRGERLVIGDVELGERLGRHALPLLDEGQKQVLGANVHLAEAARLLLREAHHLARLVGKLLKHRGFPPMVVSRL